VRHECQIAEAFVSFPRNPTQRKRSRVLSLIFFLATLVAAPHSAHAVSFNVAFDPSTGGALAGFVTAFTSVIDFYVDPITINVHVGWGDINGNPLTPGLIGQSLTNQRAFPYATLQTALTNDAKTAADATAIASLPLADPTPGQKFRDVERGSQSPGTFSR
jgi:hypothetical protein